ncbi:hypothetical protein EVAR_95966_1 [Eumeta japonica]|uniref:Uncharacterized protein n=1 Tax=Eumeta variegata TaxID=151549 RepID=A0A4C1V7M5_EUMVA|nr:hypothetical protein EVAR_95966_1 [Eumeta japonica]
MDIFRNPEISPVDASLLKGNRISNGGIWLMDRGEGDKPPELSLTKQSVITKAVASRNRITLEMCHYGTLLVQHYHPFRMLIHLEKKGQEIQDRDKLARGLRREAGRVLGGRDMFYLRLPRSIDICPTGFDVSGRLPAGDEGALSLRSAVVEMSLRLHSLGCMGGIVNRNNIDGVVGHGPARVTLTSSHDRRLNAAGQMRARRPQYAELHNQASVDDVSRPVTTRRVPSPLKQDLDTSFEIARVPSSAVNGLDERHKLESSNFESMGLR